jgi:hypothetical protein
MSIVESWARLTAVARKAGLDVSEADNPIIGSQVIEREQRRLGFVLHESVRELYQVGGMASDSTRFSLSLPGLEFPPLAE